MAHSERYDLKHDTVYSIDFMQNIAAKTTNEI
jgi:hypothetical protein